MSAEFPPAEQAEATIEERHRSWLESALESATVWGGAVLGGAAVVGAEALGYAVLRDISINLRQAESVAPAIAVGISSMYLFFTALKDSVRLACTALGVNTEWRKNSEEFFKKEE